MGIGHGLAVASGLALVAGATIAVAEAGSSAISTDREGLVKVESPRFDSVFLLPGADFRGYPMVMQDPTRVAFAKNWMPDINPPTIEFSRRTTVEDAERIAEQPRTGFGDIFAGALRSAGCELATVPAADVLRLSPRVINLYINAPDSVTTSLRTRVYTRPRRERRRWHSKSAIRRPERCSVASSTAGPRTTGPVSGSPSRRPFRTAAISRACTRPRGGPSSRRSRS
jgi:hypothetical protein